MQAFSEDMPCVAGVFMKLSPLFRAEKNKLVRIEDNLLYPTENPDILNAEDIAKGAMDGISENRLTAIEIYWEGVDFGDGVYNEELLANLRDFIKKGEEKSGFCFIVPKTKKAVADSEAADFYIAAMVHSARRIKDCANVIGFAVPEEFLALDADFSENSLTMRFIDEMNKKHGHYLYFLKRDKICGAESDANISESTFILY